MQIDETWFRSLLQEVVDDNPLCCRALFSICRVEFTTSVPTLCVSLGRTSVLQVNLDFIAAHCTTEDHVKALLVHEFLHVLLGHTLRFTSMTPALNIALDAVINAIIHRRLGSSYSDVMARYYADGPHWGAAPTPGAGVLRLLRPMRADEDQRLRELEARPDLTDAELEDLDLLRLHLALCRGHIVSDEVFDLVKHVETTAMHDLLASGKVLIGRHDRCGDPLDALEPDVADHLCQALRGLAGDGIWRDPRAHIPQVLRSLPMQTCVPAAWRSATMPLLRRLIVPDARKTRRDVDPTGCVLPILHAGDRRGYLRSLWNPLVPEITWQGSRQRHDGSVQVYLDVSGSMNAELRLLVGLLAEFHGWIRHPLWAFSDILAPATIVNGELRTETTGGTALAVVIDHIRKTRPARALVITDGFVERCTVGPLACHIEALIPSTGTPDVLEAAGIAVTRLPQV